MGGFGDGEVGVALEMNPRAVDQAGPGEGAKGLPSPFAHSAPRAVHQRGQQRERLLGAFSLQGSLGQAWWEGWGGSEKGAWVWAESWAEVPCQSF